MPDHLENLLDQAVQNKQMQAALKESIKQLFPIEKSGKKLILDKITVNDDLDENDFPHQKEIKLNRKSWHIPIFADVSIIDNKGKIIDKAENIKIGYIPKLTNRFTTIIDGNEYQTINQIRRKSGVYSHVQKNGELIAEFNLAKGQNFKMQLDPATQRFIILYANRKYRLWTLLNTIGVPDSEIEKYWGKELLEINKEGALNTETSEMTSIYKILYKKEPKDYNEVIKGLTQYFSESSGATELDKDTTKITLGDSFDAVTGKTLLAASKKLLNINNGKDVPDDRDSLIFKKIYSIDDLLLNYFDKQAPIIKSKLARTLERKDKVRDIITAASFSEPIKKFFTIGDLSSTPAQTNPVTIAAEWRKTTPMGQGGIQSRHAITMDTRDLQPTHLGFLDPLASPESAKIGVAVGLASEVSKVGNDMKTPVYDTKGNEVFLSPTEFFNYKVAFPDQYIKDGKSITWRFPIVTVMYQGKTLKVPKNEVDYMLESASSMFSFQQNLVPFMQNTQGNRASTGARMITQAMALDNKEAPFVRNYRDKNSTYEDIMAQYIVPEAPFDGIVTKITDDYIYLKSDDGKKTAKIGLYNNFPLNQDGYLHSQVTLKVNDKVKKGQPLFDHTYSDKGTLALGKNLTVAYMSYKGYNFEDGAVITKSAADKLSHTVIHKINVFYSPKLSVFDKKKFNAWYPDEITPENLNKLDDKGIIKIGETVYPDEVVCAFLVEKELDDLDKALKKLDKIRFGNYSKNVTRWDEEESGVVTDVRTVGRNIDIYIKSQHPLKEGDKIAGRFGNKSIITKIIPDSDAPHRPDGSIVEVMLSPEGVPGRMNIGQILETAAGKIAEKTGKPYIVNNFSDPNEDTAKKVFEEMKRLGIEPNEILTDGKTGQKIEKPIFVGKQYIMKLRHIVKKKQGVHNYGVYDINEQPAGKGAQKVGIMETYVYLAHGAKKNLSEMAEIKGRKNEEYWRDLQFGLPPSKPARNFIFEKMLAYLKSIGVNTEKKGNKIRIFPLTDDDVLKLSNGEIKDPGALLIGKNLLSRKDGLFDSEITGGPKGTQWSHIKLAERIPNPFYELAIMKLLDLTEQQYDNIINGKESLNDKTGPVAIVDALSKIDVKKELKATAEELKIAPPTNINKLNTKLKYLKTLDELNYTPVKAYTMQYLPIIPPVFRPVYALPSGDIMSNDVNHLYRNVGLINNGIKSTKDILLKEDQDKALTSLYNAVSVLQGNIEPTEQGLKKYKGFMKQLEKTKTGLIHGNVWAKRQDLSGRSTITVEPDLGIDEVGLPSEIAYIMFKPFVIRELKQSGLKASAALKNYEDKTELANNALQQVLKDRLVLLNRAPSLHKHSVQAFKPILSEGKSIKLNPLIVKGFNADFDGDTMSIMTPVSNEALEEAKSMMPSKILFKHGDNSLVPELSKDYVYGLYNLSLITDKVNKNYNSINEAKADGLKWTTEFKLNGKPMTIGQYMINAELPTSMRDYTRKMDGKTIHKLLEQIGKEKPQFFAEVIDSWKNLGATYSYLKGHTISITDFLTDKSFRDNLIKKEMPIIEKLPKEEKIKKVNELTLKVQDKLFDSIKNKNNLYDMLSSGSFKKKDSVRQILMMPGIMQDVKGEPIDIPILKSYGEGLDTPSYWNTLYGVRKGVVDRSVNTAESGGLNKALLYVNRRLLITMEDCNTTKGLEYNIDDKNVMDRALVETIPGVGKRNDIVNEKIINNARKKGLIKLKVRSPLTCEAPDGICKMCYGLLPNGELPFIGENVGILDSQAVTERATQLTMQTFHSGGSALAGGGISAGFPRLEQLINVPEKISKKAVLTDIDGIVKKIIKNQAGGYTITVENKNFNTAPGLLPTVTVGQFVTKGTALTDGIIKPQELSELKSHLDAQKYLVDEMDKVYSDAGFYKKTFETLVRGISDNAYITEAPENSGFDRGDTSTISFLDYLNRKRKKEHLEPIKYEPYFKSVETLNTDNEDWLTKVTTNRIKAALRVGAAKGQYGNIKGKDPIPAYIYANNFGKNTDYVKGEFY